MKFLVKVKLPLVINMQEILCGESKIVTLNFAKKNNGKRQVIDRIQLSSSTVLNAILSRKSAYCMAGINCQILVGLREITA